MYSEILYIFGPSVSTNEKFLGKGAISVMAFSRNTANDGSMLTSFRPTSGARVLGGLGASLSWRILAKDVQIVIRRVHYAILPAIT